MEDKLVTLAVIPRERFSNVKESLESIFANTRIPFEMIYVDGASPPAIRDYIKAKSQEKGFPIIRTECFLYPNQARKMALRPCKTKYIVFIDNDVIVEPGWLKPLIDCAEETGATVVGPLTCQGRPTVTTIHCAGGEIKITENKVNGNVERTIRSKLNLLGQPVAEHRDHFKREETNFAEYHCVMLRRSVFDKADVIDEGMISTMEHVDMCMSVSKAGGTIYFEPRSVVTYVSQPPLQKQDVHFFRVRWSDEWERKSLEHIRRKWNLTEDQFFKNRYKNLGYRRKNAIIKPLINKLPSWKLRQLSLHTLVFLDRIFNRLVMLDYRLRRSKALPGPTAS